MKKILAALAFAFASVTAQAAFILLPGSLTPGVDTGVFGEQTCPPPAGCVESGTTVVTFNIINLDGSMSLAFVGVVDPSSGGSYSFDVEVFDPSNNLIASGTGSPSLGIPSFNVFIGNGYTIEVEWDFTGGGNAQTASWGLVAATSENQNVPEPGTLALMGLGLVALTLVRRRRQQ